VADTPAETPAVALARTELARLANPRRDLVGAMLLPPLTCATAIMAAWILHVWSLGPSSLPTAIAWGGIAWALTIAFRFARNLGRPLTAALFTGLMGLILLVGGLLFDCFLWTISDGGCL